jgi:hypothetical protein
MSAARSLSLAKRWALVRERSRLESRNASYGEKLAQLASLMASVDDFDWRGKLARDDDRIRALWMKLRAARSRG